MFSALAAFELLKSFMANSEHIHIVTTTRPNQVLEISKVGDDLWIVNNTQHILDPYLLLCYVFEFIGSGLGMIGCPLGEKYPLNTTPLTLTRVVGQTIGFDAATSAPINIAANSRMIYLATESGVEMVNCLCIDRPWKVSDTMCLVCGLERIANYRLVLLFSGQTVLIPYNSIVFINPNGEPMISDDVKFCEPSETSAVNSLFSMMPIPETPIKVRTRPSPHTPKNQISGIPERAPDAPYKSRK